MGEQIFYWSVMDTIRLDTELVIMVYYMDIQLGLIQINQFNLKLYWDMNKLGYMRKTMNGVIKLKSYI